MKWNSIFYLNRNKNKLINEVIKLKDNPEVSDFVDIPEKDHKYFFQFNYNLDDDWIKQSNVLLSLEVRLEDEIPVVNMAVMYSILPKNIQEAILVFRYYNSQTKIINGIKFQFSNFIRHRYDTQVPFDNFNLELILSFLDKFKETSLASMRIAYDEACEYTKNKIKDQIELENRIKIFHSKTDELSDYLYNIEEEMSTHHSTSKTNNKIDFNFTIPGIEYDGSINVNDTLIRVMNELRLIKKRLDVDEIRYKMSITFTKNLLKISFELAQNGTERKQLFDYE